MKRNRRATDPRPRQTVWDDFADGVEQGWFVLSVVILVALALFGIAMAFTPS